MKRRLLLIIASLAITAVSLLVNKANKTNEEDSVFLANVEALQWEELPNGVFYECEGDFCIIFGYQNYWLGGCVQNAQYICKVQKTEFPGLG